MIRGSRRRFIRCPHGGPPAPSRSSRGRDPESGSGFCGLSCLVSVLRFRPLPAEDSLRRLHLTACGALLVAVALVLVGGVVRVSDSGLGCGPAGSGTHGWPLCRGDLLPGGQAHAVLEYTHRILAVATAILLAAILWQVLRRFRDRRDLLLATLGAVLLVLGQAGLGALTVEHGLQTALVAAHLGVAMVLLGLLEWLALAGRGLAPSPPTPARSRVAALACLLLLMTIVAGGIVAGTEERGTPRGGSGDGAHLACGKEFPTCNGAFLPFGEGEMVDVQLAHRTAMFLAVAAIAALIVLLRRERRGALALAVALALATQLWLGGLNVWVGESATLVVSHLAVATLLWLLVVAAVISVPAQVGGTGRSLREVG